MEEIWKPVPSAPLLEASSLGRVRSVPYAQPMPNGGSKEVRLAATFGLESYAAKESRHRRRIVRFRGRTYKVARLVCEAFHGPPPPGRPCVLHRDESYSNNRQDNLRWGTQKENLNAPGFIAYCRSRTGDNSSARKGQRRREGEETAAT